MKRIITLCAVALIAVGSIFAQAEASNGGTEALNSYTDTSTQYLNWEDKYADFHPKAKSVQIQIEYTPFDGTVRVFYTCMAASYDQGEAMNTVDAVLEDFQEQNKFRNKPTFVKKDRTKYFKDGRDLRMATFRRWVQYNVK